MTKRRPNRWRPAVINLGIIVVLLSAVSFLPPDTSLRERQKSGVLKLCVPDSYPPLVTGDPAMPGFDVALAQKIAEGLRLRLTVNVLSNIGRDFNPRNWQLTRSQCDIIGGGVADTPQTRGFLQTLPTGVETGWVVVSTNNALPARGEPIVVLPGTSGLDRLSLSTWLRGQGLRAVPVRTPQEVSADLSGGQATAGVMERFYAQTAQNGHPGWGLFWLPSETLARYEMAFGLWKGDDTLRRAVSAQIEDLRNSGVLTQLQAQYSLDGTIDEMAVISH